MTYDLSETNAQAKRMPRRSKNRPGCPAGHQPQDPPPMTDMSPMSYYFRYVLTLVVGVSLLSTGCTGDRVEAPPTAEEQVLLAQINRDRFVKITMTERDDFNHLVVTTQQGSHFVRYVLKPARPGDANLMIHKINDRSVLVVEESAQLGTGPQVGPNGRNR